MTVRGSAVLALLPRALAFAGRGVRPHGRAAAGATPLAVRYPDTAGLLVATVTVRAAARASCAALRRARCGRRRAIGRRRSIRCSPSSGSRVSTGTSLARLESAEQELALAQAEAAYENVGRLVKRARAMTKAGGITAADSEQVEFQYTQADIARRKARRDLELTHIVAPFAGVVTARYARPGRFVAAGDTLFRVTEAGPLLARVRIPEGSATMVRVGDQAVVAGMSGTSVKASVLHAAPAIDPASGTREVVLRLATGARSPSRRERRRQTRGSDTAGGLRSARGGVARRVRARRGERTHVAPCGDRRCRSRWWAGRGAERTLVRRACHAIGGRDAVRSRSR